ncbi:MAG: hypothetical protein ACRD8Z_27870 [Nitrososphaeraceae archaeon]
MANINQQYYLFYCTSPSPSIFRNVISESATETLATFEPFQCGSTESLLRELARIIYFEEYHRSPGGTILAENRKNKTGSTFIFTLPKVNEDLARGAGENHR